MGMQYLEDEAKRAIFKEFRPFTSEEEKVLRRDKATILSLDGEKTIKDQMAARGMFRYVYDGGDRLLKASSVITQVAIYADPRRFFVPNSGNKGLPAQEKLAEEDGRELRERLGIKDGSLDVVIPEQASTFTGLIIKYLDETAKKGKKVWLFGTDYGRLYGRTENSINESGSRVARVGIAESGDGIVVFGWPRDRGYELIRVVRLIVAKNK